MFDIDVPDVDSIPVGKAPETIVPSRRGPMAAAISENAGSLRDRQAAEDSIRAENDRLALEFVELKRAGLIVDRVPLDQIVTERLVRDRKPGPDEELDELKGSIREIGLSNPVRLERREDGRFELVQGMRRLQAYRALLEETGEDRFARIPAGIGAQEAETQLSYRRMVDENLIRKDISFAEMATLARRYAEDPANDCAEVSEAVAQLFKSASYTKRSYIRAFAELLARLDKVLMFPQEIPRNLGVELKRRMDNDDGLVARISTALRSAPERDAAQEVEILRGFLGEGEGTLPTGKTAAAKPAKPRQAKTTFQVPVDTGVARCNASDGRLELRHDLDFSSVDRHSLERAVAAFFKALEDE
ncbi:ParB/RepB/Spo0J family partition protein [Marinibacterium profundimaris]